MRGLAGRIALAAIATAGIGMAILVIGVVIIGGDAFSALMVEAGDSADHARAMYDQSVTQVVVGAAVVALAAALLIAVVLARMLARPLAEVGAAARRVAEGDYAARVPGVERVGERTICYKPADGVELITIFRAISSAASIRFSP